MARRVNKPAVAALTVGLMVVLTIVGVLLVKAMQTTDVTPIVNSAEQAIAKGDYRMAATLYKTAYDRSQDCKWLVELGKAARDGGEAGAAFAAWQTALLKDPNFVEARQSYVALWLEMLELNNWRAEGDVASRVAPHAEALLKIHPDDFNGLLACGISYLAMRKDKPELEAQGVADLEKALAMKPDDERVLTVLSNYYIEGKKQPEKARKLFETLIQQQKDNPMGYLMLGQFLLTGTEPKVDEAITLLTKATELSKNSSRTLAALAKAYQAKKDDSRADALLVKAIAADPESFDAYLQRAELLQTDGKLQESLNVAKEWLAKPAILQGFKANRYRNQHVRMLAHAANVSVALAAPARESDRPNEDMLKQAEGYLADIEKDVGKDYPLSLVVRADIYRLRGQNVQAIKALERADTIFSSSSAGVKLRLAELYRQNGDLGAAQKALAALAQLAPTFPRVYYLQAAVAAQLNNPGDALTYLDKGLLLDPKDKEMLQLKLLVLRALGGHASEIKKVEDAIGPVGTSIADKLQMANRKLAEERVDEAQAIYREVLAAEPANMTALRVMMQLLISSNHVDEAHQLFDKAKAVDNSPRIRELEFLFTQNLSAEQRDQKILELVKAEPDSDIRDGQLYIYYVTRQKFDEAQKVVDGLEAREPGSDRVVRMRFSLAMMRQDWEQAKKYADIAGQRDLDGAEGGFMRAQIAMRQGDLAKAQPELEQALTRFPSNATGWVWLSDMLIQSKQYERARDVLVSKVLEINPQNGGAFKNLAFIAQQQGDGASYQKYLEKAMQYLPSDPWVVQQGTALREQEDPDRAIQVRRKYLADNPKDVENMVRLSLLLEKKKQYKEAGDLMARAAEAAPKDLNVIGTAASYWQRRQDSSRAEKMALDFEHQAQGEEKAAANALLASLYMQQGAQEKAEQALVVAAKISSRPEIKSQLGDFYRGIGKIQDATKAYRQAVEACGKDAAAQQTTRRNLVELLLQSQSLKEAGSEIDAYHTALPNDPLYLLMRGTLLMLQGQADPAIKALSDFLQQDHNSATGFFRRGTLYLAMNRLPQAIEDLQAAKMLDPTGFHFEHRILLAQALEASKQADRAVSELKDIVQTYPPQSYADSMVAAKALALLYQRMGRPQDFETLAQTYIAQMPNDWSWSVELGRFAESTGDAAKAIKCYMQAVQASKNDPEVVDNLLRMMVSAKQYDQAIEYIQQRLPQQMCVGPIKARLAEAYCRKGQQDKARALYKEAFQEASKSYAASAAVLRNVTLTLSSQDALDMIRQRLANQPDDQATKFLLVGALSEQGKYEEALPLNDELLAAAKNDQDKQLILRQRGSLLYQAGKFEQAAKAWEQLLAIAPNDADSLNNVAYVFAENLNRPAEGLPYARRAVELRPRSTDVLDTLGWVQYLTGDTDEALGTLMSALQISPNNLAARYHIGMVYKKKTDLEQARREFERAQELIKGDPGGALPKMFAPRVQKELAELAGTGGNVAGK